MGSEASLGHQRRFMTTHGEVIAELEKVLPYDLKGLSGTIMRFMAGEWVDLSITSRMVFTSPPSMRMAYMRQGRPTISRKVFTSPFP